MPYKNLTQQRRYQREWIRNRRQKWLVKNGPCRHCGSSRILEVHHPNRTDKVEHKVWSWTQTRRIAELNKCIVLCKPCHLEVTRQQLSKPVRHGTHSAYASGCRCDECHSGHTAYMKAYYVRKKWAPASAQNDANYNRNYNHHIGRHPETASAAPGGSIAPPEPLESP